jgi:hypothetical protein
MEENKPKCHGRGLTLMPDLKRTSRCTRISWYAYERSSILSLEVALGPLIPAKWIHQQGLRAFWLNINAFCIASRNRRMPDGMYSSVRGWRSGSPRLLDRKRVRGGERALSYGIKVIGKG